MTTGRTRSKWVQTGENRLEQLKMGENGKTGKNGKNGKNGCKLINTGENGQKRADSVQLFLTKGA